MASKTLVFMGFLFAFAVLILSEVAAREVLPETSTGEKTEIRAATNGVEDAKYGGYDRGYHGYPGRDYRRGRYGRGGCRYGCCGYGGRCNRCCSYAGEVADAQPQVKPHN